MTSGSLSEHIFYQQWKLLLPPEVKTVVMVDDLVSAYPKRYVNTTVNAYIWEILDLMIGVGGQKKCGI